MKAISIEELEVFVQVMNSEADYQWNKSKVALERKEYSEGYADGLARATDVLKRIIANHK